MQLLIHRLWAHTLGSVLFLACFVALIIADKLNVWWLALPLALEFLGDIAIGVTMAEAKKANRGDNRQEEHGKA